MNKLLNWIVVLAFVAGFQYISLAGEPPASQDKPKYVFLFIGDGMGMAHIGLTEAVLASADGKIGGHTLNMSGFPVMAMSMTHAKNRFITCSAAAGTALASGEKTSINTIGMDSARLRPLYSIASRAKAKGMKVGILTSVSIDHATPAAFYAHQPDRNMYYEIGNQLIGSGFDFFGGGGFKDPKGKKRDQPDLYDAARSKGFSLVRERSAFDTVSRRSLPMMVVNPVLSESGDMPYQMDKQDGSFSLSEIVGKAITLLDNPKGFFMMVEGGKIDWAAHANDAGAVVGEVLELDKAIGYALDFYNKHPHETLIIVTADHETGGLTLGWAGTKYDSEFSVFAGQKVSYDVFEAKMKAYKKRTPASAVRFDSVMLLVDANFGLGTKVKLTKWDEEQLRRAFMVSMSDEKSSVFKEENLVLYENYDAVAVTARKLLAQKAGVGWTTWSHTCIPVPVMVKGAGQEQFGGLINNIDIPQNIAKLLHLPLIK